MAQRSRFVFSRSRVAFPGSHNRPDRFRKFWEFIEYADRAQPFFVIEGGRSADHGACRNISMGSALGGHDNAIANVAVSGDAHLAGEN